MYIQLHSSVAAIAGHTLGCPAFVDKWQGQRVLQLLEEDPPPGGQHGPKESCQYPRTPTDVQPERGLRQIAPQGAHLRLRKTALPHRNPPSGHHLHRIHGGAAQWHSLKLPQVPVGGLQHHEWTPSGATSGNPPASFAPRGGLSTRLCLPL